MRAGMSPGRKNKLSSGSISARNAGARSASATKSAYDKSSPALRHVRRHSCTSHRPARFLLRRKVLLTPPSFVKLKFKLAALMTGSGTLAPSTDQVPELIQAYASL